MAYVPNLTTQEEEEKKLLTQGNVPVSVGGSGGAMAAAPNVAGTNTAASQNQAPTNYGGSTIANIDGGGRNKPSSSGSFTNYQRYVDALSPQATRLAQQVSSSNLNRVNTGFDERLANAETQFNEQVGTASQYDEDLVNRATADPTAFMRNSQDADRLEALRTADYTGPLSYADAGLREGLDSYRQKELDMANNMNTESGREAMLSGISGYQGTRGQRLLDQYLLQNSQGAQDAFAQYGQEINTGLTGKLTEATDIAKRRAAERDRLTDEARVQTQQSLTDAASNYYSQTESEIAQRTSNILAKLNDDGTLSAQDIASLNLNPDEWQAFKEAKAEAQAANEGGAYGDRIDAQELGVAFLRKYRQGMENKKSKIKKVMGNYGNQAQDVVSYFQNPDLYTRKKEQTGAFPIGWGAGWGKRSAQRANEAGYMGDASDISVAGYDMVNNPYVQNTGSVGATAEQVRRNQALQQLAGVGMDNRSNLAGYGQMFDYQTALADAQALEAQQAAGLDAQQRQRAQALMQLLEMEQKKSPITMSRAGEV